MRAPPNLKLTVALSFASAASYEMTTGQVPLAGRLCFDAKICNTARSCHVRGEMPPLSHCALPGNGNVSIHHSTGLWLQLSVLSLAASYLCRGPCMQPQAFQAFLPCFSLSRPGTWGIGIAIRILQFLSTSLFNRADFEHSLPLFGLPRATACTKGKLPFSSLFITPPLSFFPLNV